MFCKKIEKSYFCLLEGKELVMKKFLSVSIFSTFLVIFSSSTFINTALATDQPSSEDVTKNYRFTTIDIIGKREIRLSEKIWLTPGYSTKFFDRNGFYIIRRGAFFTQDLYAEGFKRADIKVLVDGEQYHAACPNRMDASATRINPIDLGSVTFTKTSSFLSSGFYGKIEYHREEISEFPKLKIYSSGETGAQNDFDIAGSLQTSKIAFNFQVANGTPYKNGEGKSFTDTSLKYNFRENFRYGYYNVGLRRDEETIKFGANFTYADQILFPYLLMDERFSKVMNVFFSYANNKIYVNYIDHLMNNGLRSQNVTMETRAKNLTLGVIGDFYEVVFRNWEANNWIQMMGNPRIDNKMLPQARQLEATASKSFDLNEFSLYGKVGLQYFWIGDNSTLDFYRTVYPEAKSGKFGINSSLSLIYRKFISNEISILAGVEGATNLPEAEQLFLALKRPMTKPNWVGNPTLLQPVRGTFRIGFNVPYLRLENFVHYVSNYVDIVSINFETKKAQTYSNVNAVIFGINATLKFEDYFESNIQYLYGENISSKSPLAEIAPLTIVSKIVTSSISNFITLGIEHRWENAQKRVDTELNETPSRAWNRISLFLDFDVLHKLHLRFEINNLLNANYSNFFAYSRNPFSAGTKVYEPGRTFRLTIFYDSSF